MEPGRDKLTVLLRLTIQVEAKFAKLMAVPIVQLCVQGGPGALSAVYNAAKNGTPCVVVAQSGGVSTELWNYYSSCSSRTAMDGRLPMKRDKAGNATDVPMYQVKDEHGNEVNMLAEIKRMDIECDDLLITFYDIGDKEGGESDDLAHFLLKVRRPPSGWCAPTPSTPT